MSIIALSFKISEFLIHTPLKSIISVTYLSIILPGDKIEVALEVDLSNGETDLSPLAYLFI